MNKLTKVLFTLMLILVLTFSTVLSKGVNAEVINADVKVIDVAEKYTNDSTTELKERGYWEEVIVYGTKPGCTPVYYSEECDLDTIEKVWVAGGQDIVFEDLSATSTHWAKDSVYNLVKNAIVFGSKNSEGKFVYNLDNKLTRGQFSLMLSRTLPNVHVDKDVVFTDMKNKSEEGIVAVQTLHELGIVNGYSNGSFGFDDTITREQASLMLIRYLNALDIDYTDIKTNTPFTDVSKLSAESQKAIGILYNLGIVHGVGDNQFNPNGSLTRAAMAKMLDGLLVSTVVDGKIDPQGYYETVIVYGTKPGCKPVYYSEECDMNTYEEKWVSNKK